MTDLDPADCLGKKTSPSLVSGKRVPLIIGFALFMQTLDGHSIASILPVAAREFGKDPIAMNLAITVYFASAAAFLPASGWFADRFGTRTTFQAAILTFVLGSTLCATAPSAAMLYFGRAIQGIAGAGLLPVGRLLIIRTSRKRDLIDQLTWLTLPPLLGPLLGPVAAGAMATFASWRWIFFVNLPIGLAGCFMVGRFVPQVKEDHRPALDWRGATLAAASLVSLVLLLERVGRADGLDIGLCALLVTTLLASIGYAWHVRHTDRPILDLSLFRIPTFRAGTIGGLFVRLSIGAETFLYAMLFQVDLGMSAFLSGMLIASSSVGMMAMRRLSVRLIKLFGFRNVLLTSALIGSVTLAIPAFFDGRTSLMVIVVYLIIRGLIRSIQLNSINSITYADPPRDQASAASSLAATLQQICQGAATALAATLVALLPPVLAKSSLQPIGAVFVVLSLVGFLSLPFTLTLAGDAGSNISGRGRRHVPREAIQETGE